MHEGPAGNALARRSRILGRKKFLDAALSFIPDYHDLALGFIKDIPSIKQGDAGCSKQVKIRLRPG